MEKNEIFRDTKDQYLNIEKYASPKLINFAVNNSGKEILDLGCATGDYCSNLEALGFNSTGADINPKYIEKAHEMGINAHVMKGENLKFQDNTFDTVLLFEVLEHVDNLYNVLKEAKRVAKKNILITVPNCTQFFKLKKLGLTYEYMLEKDHINFFTKEDLEKLILKEFKHYKIDIKEPIQPNPLLIAAGLSRWLRGLILLFNKINIFKPSLYYRLYAVVEVEQ